MKKFLAVLSLAATGFGVSAPASAALTVYTDRAAWAAAAGSVSTENFNSMVNGTLVTGATVFPSGITVTGGGVDISNFAFGSIGQGNALQMSQQTTISLPGAVTAFGFDYEDVDLSGVSISIGAFLQALAFTGDADAGITPDDFAFFGVVGTAGDIPGGLFSFATSEGFSIDNLSFSANAVPEPTSLALLGLGLVGLAAARKRKQA